MRVIYSIFREGSREDFVDEVTLDNGFGGLLWNNDGKLFYIKIGDEENGDNCLERLSGKKERDKKENRRPYQEGPLHMSNAEGHRLCFNEVVRSALWMGHCGSTIENVLKG